MKLYLSRKNVPGGLVRQPDLEFSTAFAEEEDRLVNIEDDFEYQTIHGFGGAITEASAETFARLPDPWKADLLRCYYDPEHGIGYTHARLHINSCDFALGNYAYDETDGDFDLKHFDMSHDERAIFPLVRAAAAAAGRSLWILGSPWSPPAWMKTTGQMNRGGKLRPECRDAWARYYVKFVEACRAAGIGVSALSVQNEPKATQTWDSCIYTAEEERDFIRDHLGPALRAAGLADSVALFFWDHNKERVLERARAMLGDPVAASMVAGIAVHWYSGTHFEQLRMFAERYPGKEIILSECCCEASVKELADLWDQAEHYAEDISGNLNNGLSRWIDWNILLDAEGGPNHVRNFCNAPFRANADYTAITAQPSYYAIGHYSRFIRPGARRIGWSAYTQNLDVTAAKNTDGTIAVVVHNRADRALPVNLRFHGAIAKSTLPARAIATYVF